MNINPNLNKSVVKTIVVNEEIDKSKKQILNGIKNKKTIDLEKIYIITAKDLPMKDE